MKTQERVVASWERWSESAAGARQHRRWGSPEFPEKAWVLSARGGSHIAMDRELEDKPMVTSGSRQEVDYNSADSTTHVNLSQSTRS